MEDCIFCKIIKGELSCNKVYEDDLVYCFLDINPHSDGDCLIVPKEHILDFHDASDELMIHINNVIKDLEIKYHLGLKSDGLSIIYNSGIGQEVKHFHIHMIPRYDLHDITLKAERELKPVDEVYEIIKKEFFN
ncbi:MAG: HIT domain-containing protein [Bacilli bacterium]|nr:HIT domain-containing protein [Bacilli bacterium]